jgi:hypothetical protein
MYIPNPVMTAARQATNPFVDDITRQLAYQSAHQVDSVALRTLDQVIERADKSLKAYIDNIANPSVAQQSLADSQLGLQHLQKKITELAKKSPEDAAKLRDSVQEKAVLLLMKSNPAYEKLIKAGQMPQGLFQYHMQTLQGLVYNMHLKEVAFKKSPQGYVQRAYQGLSKQVEQLTAKITGAGRKKPKTIIQQTRFIDKVRSDIALLGDYPEYELQKYIGKKKKLKKDLPDLYKFIKEKYGRGKTKDMDEIIRLIGDGRLELPVKMSATQKVSLKNKFNDEVLSLGANAHQKISHMSIEELKSHPNIYQFVREQTKTGSDQEIREILRLIGKRQIELPVKRSAIDKLLFKEELQSELASLGVNPQKAIAEMSIKQLKKHPHIYQFVAEQTGNGTNKEIRQILRLIGERKISIPMRESAARNVAFSEAVRDEVAAMSDLPKFVLHGLSPQQIEQRFPIIYQLIERKAGSTQPEDIQAVVKLITQGRLDIPMRAVDRRRLSPLKYLPVAGDTLKDIKKYNPDFYNFFVKKTRENLGKEHITADELETAFANYKSHSQGAFVRFNERHNDLMDFVNATHHEASEGYIDFVNEVASSEGSWKATRFLMLQKFRKQPPIHFDKRYQRINQLIAMETLGIPDLATLKKKSPEMYEAAIKSGITDADWQAMINDNRRYYKQTGHEPPKGNDLGASTGDADFGEASKVEDFDIDLKAKNKPETAKKEVPNDGKVHVIEEKDLPDGDIVDTDAVEVTHKPGDQPEVSQNKIPTRLSAKERGDKSGFKAMDERADARINKTDE